ncbi:putative fluoride ion transporter CrcB [Prochlorococcus marinus str. MIT 1313]|uniref:fluoride efflux transporter FluC n=1 Tax=Prochlorococcus TaxID=1218 RepID=UPI0007B3E57D|nr:CrcB family protein [Prochlorococcus marinus]KZR72367.1 putative fluoride ion transporter CrcB [Prochlorococcus marinus str. MIT 1313]KZR74040.1 putative fluoride ion transporter CrcB [Prochlorococcus marinus str. MIT 1318]
MAKTTLRNEFTELCLVALGAVPGAWIRWQADNDLVVNVVGAAILGLLVGLPLRPRRQLMLGVGFCGALTTFSSWMVECSTLISKGAWLSALGLIGLTMGLGLGVAALGFLIGRQFRPSGLGR